MALNVRNRIQQRFSNDKRTTWEAMSRREVRKQKREAYKDDYLRRKATKDETPDEKAARLEEERQAVQEDPSRDPAKATLAVAPKFPTRAEMWRRWSKDT